MKRLFFLTLGAFAIGSGSYMMAGLLPKIGQTIGQPISITSQGITAFTLTYLLSAPVFSVALANKSGKRVLQLALVVFLLGNLITISANNIFIFIMGRILTGLGAGIFNPLCASFAVQMGPPAARGRILSQIWAAGCAGAVFGVPIGLYVSNTFSWRYSIGYIFVLTLVALTGFSLQKSQLSLPATSSLSERLRLLANKNILSVIGITCLTTTASLGLYSYVTAVHSGAANSLTVSLFAWGMGGFIGSATVGILIDRTKKPRAVMALLIAGLMLSFLAIPFTKDLNYFGLLPFFLWGLFGWATPTTQQSVLFEMYETQRTVLSALNSSAIGLGGSIGTAIGGVLISSGFNTNHLPFVSAALLIGVVLLQLRSVVRE